MSRNINELLGSENEVFRSVGDSFKSVLRCACPGIIQSFDSVTQTCTVQLAIREEVTKEDYTKSWADLPLLLDVPIVIPRAGGYCLTLPINKGDECLIIFNDMCIDGWFSLGGIQNQLEKRRHDLSDATAILGMWSQPNTIEYYSTNSAQLRSEKGSSVIDLKENEINISSETVKINGIDFSKHIHDAPNSGGQTSYPSSGQQGPS